MKMVCHAQLRNAKRMKEWNIPRLPAEKNAKVARKILMESHTDAKHAQQWDLYRSFKTPRMLPNAWTPEESSKSNANVDTESIKSVLRTMPVRRNFHTKDLLEVPGERKNRSSTLMLTSTSTELKLTISKVDT